MKNHQKLYVDSVFESFQIESSELILMYEWPKHIRIMSVLFVNRNKQQEDD